jgi:hypothetical protein
MCQSGRHAPQSRKPFRLAELFLGVEHRLVESSVFDGGRRLRGERQRNSTSSGRKRRGSMVYTVSRPMSRTLVFSGMHKRELNPA